MYTKPSVDDLIEGVTRTLEQGLLPLLKDRPDAAQAIPPVVATLQRVTQEWAAAVSNLVASNDDIDFPGLNWCSRITATLSAGRYYLRVRGYGGATLRYYLTARSG